MKMMLWKRVLTLNWKARNFKTLMKKNLTSRAQWEYLFLFFFGLMTMVRQLATKQVTHKKEIKKRKKKATELDYFEEVFG